MKNKEKNFISAVVYVKNAEKTIFDFFNKINKVFEGNFFKYEIIFVNDGSVDHSIEIIKEQAKKTANGSISIINMSYIEGKELSMNAGLDLAIGDFIFEFENTVIDYSIETIMEIYRKCLEGYDIVNASSTSKRKFSSKLFYGIFNKYASLEYKIDTDTFKIISRRTVNRINAMNKTIPYRKAILANCGLKMTTIKYDAINEAKINYDKKTKKEREKNALDSLILFTDVSYKFTILMIVVFMILTLVAAGYTTYTFLMNNPIKGWTTTMLYLSFGFLGIFFVLAIIIKYLAVIINLVFKKTNYLIESIEKIN